MAQLGNLSMQGVTVTPKFLFGVNGQVNNCLHMIDEKKLLYVAGHNAIVYNIDDPTNMQFVPGSENTECINYIAVSAGAPSSRFLAMCERGRQGGRAQITIFDNLRKKRTIPEPDSDVDMGITSREFLCAAFSPKNEKEHLITLSGEPDWEIILWKWDTFKLLARVPLHVTAPEVNPLSFQCSIQNIATELMVVATGTQTYRYMKVAVDLHSLEVVQ